MRRVLVGYKMMQTKIWYVKPGVYVINLMFVLMNIVLMCNLFL